MRANELIAKRIVDRLVLRARVADRCDPVNVTAHATPDSTNTSWYAQVTYSCHPGYEWPSPNSVRYLMCRPGGTWNDSFGDANDCRSAFSRLCDARHTAVETAMGRKAH